MWCALVFVDCTLEVVFEQCMSTPRGGDSHMKGVGVLVISLRGVNFGFWSHLGCSGQNAITFSGKGQEEM